MENTKEFNDKLGKWLQDSNQHLSDRSAQEKLLELIEAEQNPDVKNVLQKYMKLSLIVKNNPDNTDKLINYLIK